MRWLAWVAAWLCLTGTAAAQVGYMTSTAQDPQDRPLSLHIWYPTTAKAERQAVGAYTHEAALNAPIAGERLPLIVISHGAGGSGTNQADTAVDLAKAGFVVAAVTHSGDNSRDQRFAGSPLQFSERSRHVSRVIDFMTRGWIGAPRLDASRIGLVGYSAGGTTALAVAGGDIDLARFGPHCARRPEERACAYVAAAQKQAAAAGAPAGSGPPKSPPLTHDARVKAVVLAAPALGYLFGPENLRGVRAPVQIWAAEKDDIAPTEDSSAAIRQDLPRRPDYRLVAGAGHSSFLPVCSDELRQRAAGICADPAGFDRAAFRPKFSAGVVQFFRQALRVR